MSNMLITIKQSCCICDLPNHLIRFFVLQGDPGGVVGIIPVKGDKGYAGTPGFPVRLFVFLRRCMHVFMCADRKRQTEIVQLSC